MRCRTWTNCRGTNFSLDEISLTERGKIQRVIEQDNQIFSSLITDRVVHVHNEERIARIVAGRRRKEHCMLRAKATERVRHIGIEGCCR